MFVIVTFALKSNIKIISFIFSWKKSLVPCIFFLCTSNHHCYVLDIDTEIGHILYLYLLIYDSEEISWISCFSSCFSFLICKLGIIMVPTCFILRVINELINKKCLKWFLIKGLCKYQLLLSLLFFYCQEMLTYLLKILHHGILLHHNLKQSLR